MLGDQFYMEAFWELSTTRALGQGGIGPIPWNFVIDYGFYKQLDADNIELLAITIRLMDEAYMKWYSEEAKRLREQTRPTSDSQ